MLSLLKLYEQIQIRKFLTIATLKLRGVRVMNKGMIYPYEIPLAYETLPRCFRELIDAEGGSC
jgi:hypothetical protein